MCVSLVRASFGYRKKKPKTQAKHVLKVWRPGCSWRDSLQRVEGLRSVSEKGFGKRGTYAGIWLGNENVRRRTWGGERSAHIALSKQIAFNFDTYTAFFLYFTKCHSNQKVYTIKPNTTAATQRGSIIIALCWGLRRSMLISWWKGPRPKTHTRVGIKGLNSKIRALSYTHKKELALFPGRECTNNKTPPEWKEGWVWVAGPEGPPTDTLGPPPTERKTREIGVAKRAVSRGEGGRKEGKIM